MLGLLYEVRMELVGLYIEELKMRLRLVIQDFNAADRTKLHTIRKFIIRDCDNLSQFLTKQTKESFKGISK